MMRWLTSPFEVGIREKGMFPERPDGATLHDSFGGNDELGAVLTAITDEVHRHASAARQGVLVDFGARAAHARKHLSRHLLAATLAAIKEQRNAALALISRNAALERASRRKAAISALSGKNPAKYETKKPTNDAPGNAPMPRG